MVDGPSKTNKINEKESLEEKIVILSPILSLSSFSLILFLSLSHPPLSFILPFSFIFSFIFFLSSSYFSLFIVSFLSFFHSIIYGIIVSFLRSSPLSTMLIKVKNTCKVNTLLIFAKKLFRVEFFKPDNHIFRFWDARLMSVLKFGSETGDR